MIEFGSFDNRDEPFRPEHQGGSERIPVARRLRGQVTGSRLLVYRSNGAHLRFSVAGKHFVYAYIRKNGCTTFSKYLNSYCPNQTSRRSLGKLKTHLGVSWQYQLKGTHRILVLRDPVTRVCSLFRNKLVQKDRAEDITANIAGLMGTPPDELSFRTFINKYIAKNIDGVNPSIPLDPHCARQTSYLWPIEYDRVFALDQLYDASLEMFGADIADAHFKSKKNATTSRGYNANVSDVSVRELHAAYLEKGVLPSDSDLLDQTLEEAITALYQSDIDLMRQALPNRNLGE